MINNALDRTDRIERILMVLVIELVVELMDWRCVAVVVVVNECMDFAKYAAY
jgi:hypothetical protein